MIPSITFMVTLVALLAVGETAVTSHSSTEEPTTTSTTTMMSTTSDTTTSQSTTPALKKSALSISSTTTTTTTTKRSVTEELEDTHILGDTTQDDSDEDDDSEEIDDEPLPTLAPMLATALMPPNQDAEVLSSHWNPPPKQTESKVPFGLLIIRIIQIVKPKEQLGNNFSPLKFSQNNNYRPMYSSTLASDDTLCSDENDNEGEKSVPTSQSMTSLQEDNNEIPFRNYGNTNSYYNTPTPSPFFSRFVPSTWNNRPYWYNNFRGFNTFGNLNY